jgi:hypothetical protein
MYSIFYKHMYVLLHSSNTRLFSYCVQSVEGSPCTVAPSFIQSVWKIVLTSFTQMISAAHFITICTSIALGILGAAFGVRIHKNMQYFQRYSTVTHLVQQSITFDSSILEEVRRLPSSLVFHLSAPWTCIDEHPHNVSARTIFAS